MKTELEPKELKPINDGGPAFPLPEGLKWPGHDSHGMSLRDYFAGMALQAIIGKTDREKLSLNERTSKEKSFRAARGAYAYADAMIKVRESNLK